MATKLTLSGDVNYDGDINNFLAAKVIALVEQENQPVQQTDDTRIKQELLGNGLDRQPTMFAGKALIEALAETGAKDKPQMIAVAGQRAMEENGADVFSSKDVIEQFKSSGISSRNLGRDANKAVSLGLIYSVTGQKGSYKVTETAQRAFGAGFDQVKTHKSTIRKPKKVGASNKLEISEAVTKLSIQVSMEGYPDYHEVNVKGERIIWLLIFAAKNDIPSLNSKEVEFLSRSISDNLPASSLPALTASMIKKGYIAKSQNQYMMLHKGDIYIKEKSNQ